MAPSASSSWLELGIISQLFYQLCPVMTAAGFKLLNLRSLVYCSTNCPLNLRSLVDCSTHSAWCQSSMFQALEHRIISQLFYQLCPVMAAAGITSRLLYPQCLVPAAAGFKTLELRIISQLFYQLCPVMVAAGFKLLNLRSLVYCSTNSTWYLR